MGILKAIGIKALEVINCGIRFVGKHPVAGYFIIGLPACFLMANGAYALAGDPIIADDIPKIVSAANSKKGERK